MSRPAKSPVFKVLAADPKKGKARASVSPISLGPCNLDPPAHLDEIALVTWNYYAPMLDRAGTLRDADRTALERMCIAYSDARRLRTLLQETGMVYEVNGAVRAHPYATLYNDTEKRLFAYMTALGLTPVSRNRVIAEPKAETTKEERFF